MTVYHFNRWHDSKVGMTVCCFKKAPKRTIQCQSFGLETSSKTDLFVLNRAFPNWVFKTVFGIVTGFALISALSHLFISLGLQKSHGCWNTRMTLGKQPADTLGLMIALKTCKSSSTRISPKWLLQGSFDCYKNSIICHEMVWQSSFLYLQTYLNTASKWNLV